jgi:hypothetical protein
MMTDLSNWMGFHAVLILVITVLASTACTAALAMHVRSVSRELRWALRTSESARAMVESLSHSIAEHSERLDRIESRVGSDDYRALVQTLDRNVADHSGRLERVELLAGSNDYHAMLETLDRNVAEHSARLDRVESLARSSDHRTMVEALARNVAGHSERLGRIESSARSNDFRAMLESLDRNLADHSERLSRIESLPNSNVGSVRKLDARAVAHLRKEISSISMEIAGHPGEPEQCAAVGNGQERFNPDA